MMIKEFGIKGHVKVVATNIRTGEVKIVETDNVITASGASLLKQAWLTGKYVVDFKDPGVTYSCPGDISLYKRPYWALVLGTGTGTPSTSDTGLFNAIASTARGAGQDGTGITIETDPGTGHETVNITGFPYGAVAELVGLDRGWQYHVRYTPEEANGYTYTEVGIFENIPPTWYLINDDYREYYIPPNHYTKGTLFEHALLPESIDKTPDILLDVYVSIQIQP